MQNYAVFPKVPLPIIYFSLYLSAIIIKITFPMHIIDLIIFIVFTGGIVVFGCSFFKGKTSSDEFTSAGRSLPGWVVGMSIFSTYVSSISYLGYPSKAFSSDWNAYVFSLSIPIASYFAAKYFVPFYRKQTCVSAYSFLEKRFGLWARLYASACYLLTQIARTGSILYLLALPMNILMGWEIHVVIITTSVLIILYSILGGIKAVIWTEAVQGFILIAGAIVCLGILLFSMPEGPSQTFTIAWEQGKFSLGSFSADLTTSTFWVCLIYGIFTNLQNYGIDQNYVQRYHTAKSLKEAKFSALFGGYLYIPVSALFFLIGTALFSYYQVYPELMPTENLKTDYIFPYFIVHQLPVGLTGLLIASIFAAGMSTVATSITSSSTIILTDYFKRIKKNSSDKEDLFVLKFSSGLIGVLGIIVAIGMLSVDNIIDAWWKLSSIFSGGMLGLFLLGYLAKKVHRIHAVIGVICGVMVIGWISLAEHLQLPGPHIHEYLAIVFGTIIIFLVGFLLSLLIKRI